MQTTLKFPSANLTNKTTFQWAWIIESLINVWCKYFDTNFVESSFSSFINLNLTIFPQSLCKLWFSMAQHEWELSVMTNMKAWLIVPYKAPWPLGHMSEGIKSSSYLLDRRSSSLNESWIVNNALIDSSSLSRLASVEVIEVLLKLFQ